MVIDRALLVVCTHNPNPPRLWKVLNGIRSNTAPFRLVVIDNASSNSAEWDFQSEFRYELIIEPRLGNAYARKVALNILQDDELLIFIDDDNIIPSNFVLHALMLIGSNPHWGCYGGRSKKDEGLKVPFGFKIFLPFLGIRDLGNENLEVRSSKSWNIVEPIGAGMCLHPKLVTLIRSHLDVDSNAYFSLGRKGGSLVSGEDSFFARMASELNMFWGYSPSLEFIHDINPSRLKLKYLVNLLFSYGVSDVRLDSALSVDPISPYPQNAFSALYRFCFSPRKGAFGLILGLRHFGQFVESKRIN
jgi:glycosyltransferase involved in cell wall biosynthesis